MQAIILAAGMGKRLGELTKNNTKCMVKVNGITIIERLLHQLDSRRLSKIVIVTGYEGGKLVDYISSLELSTPIIYVDNKVYASTNNIYSLFLARDYLIEQDTILFESDIICDDSVIDELLDDPRETLALVDKYEGWMDGTCVKLSEDDYIREVISKNQFNFDEKNEYYKTVNIYKFSRDFSKTVYVPFLKAYMEVLGNNEYYEQVLRVISTLDNSIIQAKRLNGHKWYEIDDVQDLDIAETMFAGDEEKVALLQKRYGGYWRYPELIDFCYLINPYFPPAKLMDEIKASFETILTQYPSGIRVNSLLAAKNFNIHQENIIVGNGAAELIKSLMQQFEGTFGFVRPTFEEYPNRNYNDEVVFRPENKNFSYSVDDLISFFGDKRIRNLIIINPDNPSGNYINKKGILKLIKWGERENIRMIVDESFVDFSEEENSTLIQQDILDANKHLFVMKSISKSYGVPGLRLGILASGDTEMIDLLKKDVSIWNINSFAEFYMQIEEKYKSDYVEALDKFREERKRLIERLNQIKSLRVIPTQANYVMLEVLNGSTTAEVTKNLLLKHNILVKDLSGKIKDGEYLRIAIRGTEDNNRLLEALSKVCDVGKM